MGKANSTGQNFVPLLSQKRAGFQDAKQLWCFLFDAIAVGESSPEKAGGGGSIPSLQSNIQPDVVLTNFARGEK